MQGPLIVRSIHQAALATLSLQKLAVLLSSSAFAESISKLHPSTLTLLKSLMGEGSVSESEEDKRERENAKGRPELAALYMLQLISSSNLVTVLQTRPVLKKLGLTKWVIIESIFLYVINKANFS